MENRVKQFRTELGLSQKKLAEMVGTSQQQIQRIETGTVAARLEMATSLSRALGKPLDIVFPGAGKVFNMFVEEPTERYSDKAFEEFGKTGVEADPRVWTLKVLLRGHREPLAFRVSGTEQRRLSTVMQEESGDAKEVSFVVFDTESERIALNLGEMLLCHFLWDDPTHIMKTTKEEPSGVRVCFCGDERPWHFEVDIDEGDPDDDDDLGQFRHILFMMETYAEKHERYVFEDEDGEVVFLRAGDVALMRVPLWIIESHNWDEEDD